MLRVRQNHFAKEMSMSKSGLLQATNNKIKKGKFK